MSGYLMSLTNWQGETYIAYSINGYEWPTRPTPLFSSLSGGAASPTLFAVNDSSCLMFLLDNPGHIYAAASTEGIKWPGLASGTDALFGGWQTRGAPTIVFDGKRYLMFLLDWDHKLYVATSSDGTTWQRAGMTQLFTGAQLPVAPAVIYDGKQYLMYMIDGDGRIYQTSSTDGVAWPKTLPQAALFNRWQTPHVRPTVLVDGTRYLMFLLDWHNILNMTTSSDGVSWSGTPGPLLNNWKAAASPNVYHDGTQYVMYVLDGAGQVYVASSQDGLTWTGPVVGVNELWSGWSGVKTSPAVVSFKALANPTSPGLYGNWMKDLMTEHSGFAQQSLKTMIIPGSHDAAMYRLTKRYPVIAAGIASSNATTQDQNLYYQLCGGVRYFDFRPTVYEGNYYFTHSSARGPSVAEVLRDIHAFMSRDGCQEIIVLKFSHFDNFNADGSTYKDFISYVTGNANSFSLQSWLYNNDTDQRLADVPLSTLVADGSGKVFICCDGTFPVDYPQRGVYVYRDASTACPQEPGRSLNPLDGHLRIFDCYSNAFKKQLSADPRNFNLDALSYDVTGMYQDQLAKYNDYDGNCDGNYGSVPCDLFLISWTLTPPGHFPASVWPAAQAANQALSANLSAFKKKNPSGLVPNIVYVDMYESSSVTQLCINLNTGWL